LALDRLIAVVLLSFGYVAEFRPDGAMSRRHQAFKKGMQDDEKTAEKPAEPVKTIDHNATPSTAARSDVGSKAV